MDTPIFDNILENVLPQALRIGVDYYLFWELNPKELAPFIKAFELKQKYDDSMAWNIGDYVRMAIGDAFSKRDVYPKNPKSQIEKAEIMSPEEIKERVKARIGELKSRKKGEW